jgi:hypothetical protein
MRKYQFGSAERRRVKEVAQIGAFIRHLDRHVRILDYSIAAEQHARVSDRFDAACPILARTYSARGDNLKDTKSTISNARIPRFLASCCTTN